MTRIGKLKSVSFVALLLVGTASAVGFASLFLGALPSIPPVHAAGGAGTPLLGFDCGLGSIEGVDIDGDGVPEGDKVHDASCTWSGSADFGFDLVFDPLVSDDPLSFPPGTGGGFTVEILATNLPNSTNGFDITFFYNTRYLDGVKIDQTGLPFGNPSNTPLTLVSTIDRTTGEVRLAQVILTGSVSGTVTLFRVRFDVVGVGNSPLTITSSIITNPNAVAHKVSQGNLDSRTIFNLLNPSPSFFDVFWSFSPNPGVPGMPLSLSATASCAAAGCSISSYSWDTNSDGVSEASGASAMITPPPPVAHRVVLTVTDNAGNTATAVRRLPLAVAVSGPSTVNILTANSWTGRLIGGIPSYTGAWRFCPGSAFVTTVCTLPAASASATDLGDQTDARSTTYKFAGIYTNTFRVTDTVKLQVSSTASSAIATFLVNVTGTPQAYTVTVTSSVPKANAGESVNFTATVAYAGTYPLGFRSSTFNYFFDFGDGAIATVSGGLSASSSHTYSSGGTFTVKVVAQETAFAAVSKIQEVGRTTITINVGGVPPTPDFTFSPANPTAGKPVTFTDATTGGTPPYTLAWNFGDGSPAASGSSVIHTYAVKGSYNVTMTVTDSAARTATATKTVVVGPQPLVVTVDCPNSGLTAGKPFNCTVSATGGTSPYTGTGSMSVTRPTKGTFTQTFSVTDANGATASGSDTVVIVAQPLIVTVDCPNSGLTAGKPFTCNVSATGGTSPYTGTGVRSVTQPVKGTFTQTFSVTDANGVTASGSDSVTIAAQPLVVIVDCPNTGLTAGKPFNCNVSATGGTSPYTGTGARSVTQPTKGIFTVTLSVTDANAVTASGSDSVTIAAQPLVVTVDCPNTGLTAGKPFNCNVSATGGTSPYTGTGARSVTQPTKGTFTQTFSVTDANAVTASGSDSVTIAAQPLVVTVDCPNTGLTAGKPFNCNVSATGGTSPYTGTGVRSATQPTKGTFTQTFSVTDANAVTASGSDSVTIAAQPLVVTVDCPNTGLTAGKPFNCNVSATGGTSPYTGTGVRSATQPVKGTFSQTFSVTDANAVTASGSDSVTIAAQPLVVTVDCPNTGLTAGKPFNCNVTATGGTSPYTGTGARSVTRPTKGTFTQTFSVTDANAVTASGSDSVTIAAQPLVVTVDCPNTGLTAGKPFNCNVSATGGTSPYTGTGVRSATQPTKGTFTQSFSVTDANAVTASGSDSVTIAAQPLVTSFTFTPASPLVGQSVTFTATASGGTGPYTFSWTFGDGGIGTGSPVSHTYATKGSFTVTLTTRDANTVVVTAVRTVAVSGATLVVTVDCPNIGLTAGKPFNCNVTATGGTPPYTGTGSRSVTQPTKGTFTVTLSVTDANGATASGSDSVTIAAQPLVVTVDCPNTGLTAGKPFTCNVSATGGTSPYTGTGAMSVTRPTKGTFTQTFSVTDANAVTASGSDSVTIAAQPLVVTVDCPNTGLTAGKPFNCNVTATGGTSPYTGTGVRSATRPTKGTFTQTFSVTDANAVTASGSDSVTIAAQPLVVTVDCPNTGLTAGKPFNCNVSATGGTSPYTGTGVRSVTQPVKGTFTVTFSVTDANAVTASGSDSVTIAAQPLVVTVDCPNTGLTAGKPFNCNVTATGGTSPYTGTGVRSATRPTKGTFTQTFSVTDANAVTASGSDSVTIAAQPLVVTVDCPNTGLTAGKPFNCTVSATGGTAPYTGTGTRSATQPTKGTFSQSFSVTDSNGATASGSDSVTIAAQPLVVTVDCPNTGLTAGKPFTCNVSATGGTSPYTGTGVRSVTQPVKGTFTQSFTVTDANAVTASGSDSVTIAAQPLVVTVDCPNTGLTAGKPFNCNVSATGGTSPYTGTGVRSATQPTKGTFTQSFSVTDANAVTASGSDSVTIAAQPLVTSFTFTPASPLVGQSVTFTATASGGTGPYTFSWTFGDGSIGTGSPVSHAYAAKGSFSVTLTTRDANNVVATSVRTVAVSGQTLVVTVDCPNTGLTAGKPFNCTVSATGGTTPYTGTGSISVTRPTKGTFTQSFTVTDANGATASGSDTVTIAAQPLVVTVDCPNTGLTAGKPFTCTVSATGGTSPYTGTGAMSVTRPTKGTFTQSFSVTDANGVTASGSDTVVIAGQPLVTDFTFTPANPLVGQSVTFTATASGGTGPYTFSWTFGDGSIGTGSPVSHSYASKGSKTVTLSTRDANNVVVTAVHTVAVSGQTLVVTVNCPNTGLTAGKPFNCTVSATGGTTPYTGTGSVSVTRPTKGTFTQTFSVTDANGATASGSDTVVIAAQPLVVTVDCPNTGLTAGKPFNCNVTATGGTSPYTGTGAMSVIRPTKGTFTQSFSVTDANGVTASGSDSVTIAPQPLVVIVDCPNTGLTAGKPFNCNVTAGGGTSPYVGTGVRSATQPVKGTFTQSFSVNDGNGVTASGSDTVTIAAQPLVTDFTFTPASPLVGQAVTFTATASGGTGPYTFSWTFGDGGTGTGSPVSHSYAAKGSFTVTLTTRDANNVVVTAVHTVPVGGVALSVTVDCPNTGLTAGKPFNCTVSATGGTAPYTGTGTRSVTQPTKGSFTQTFSVTDANGSTASGSDTVVIAGQPLVVTVDCPNTGLTAGKPFNCTVSATGGTAPYTGTGVRSVTQPVKGTFTVTFSVTDSNGATASGSDSVTIAAQPLVVTVDCPNTGLTAGKPFTCNVSATGGTSPYTGTGAMSVTRPTKGTFTQTFSVTDANAVTASGSDSVTIAAQPLVVTVDCPNTGLTAGKPFNCNVSATGGTSPYTGTGAMSVTRPTKGTFTQSFSVTDANAVTASGSDSVTIAAQPLVVTVDCPNTGLTAGKPFNCNVSATGGTSPYTGTGVRSVTQPVKGTFTQTFSVTDANGVTASGSDSVTIAAQPLVTSFTFTPASPLVGQSVTFTATASGGTGPYTFSWTFGDGGIGTGSPVSHTYATKGSFTVTLTTRDANTVVVTAVRTVAVSGATLVVTVDCPNIGLTAGKPFNCNVTATGGTPPYTGTGSRSVTQPTKGTFTVTLSVTDANGATASGSDSVTIAAQPLVVTVDCPNTGLTAGKPFTCNVSATGGTSPYTGTGAMSVTRPTKGTFTQSFSVTDANAVTASGSDSVTIAAQPLVSDFTFTPASPLVGQSVTFTATASGGTGPYTFSWTFGDGSTGTGSPVSHSYAAKGSFSVTLTTRDANNVVATSVRTVVVSGVALVVTVDCPNTGLTAGKPFNCTVSATGGTAPYTGTGAMSVTRPTKGTFTQTFSVTDANGATASGSDSVTIAAQPLVVTVDCPNTGLTAGKPFNCNVSATGGTSPYTGTGTRSVTQPTKGTFTVTLSVTDANGASASGTDTVTIAPQPLAVTVDCPNTGLTAGKPFNCNVSATGGTAPYTGTGARSATQPTKGTFTQTFSVTDANGATASAVDSVTIAPQPLMVTVDCPNSGLTAGKPFNCTVSATGGTSPYTGTGVRSATQPTKGTFTQTFSVTDANGATASGSDTVVIAAQPLVTDFTFSPASPLAGQSVTFTASASGGTGPYTFSWTFGDGSTGTGSPVSHTYAAKGSFTVTLTTRDANSAIATASHIVSVSPQPLMVAFTFSPASPAIGQTVTFTATVSGGSSPYMFSWSFGDGSTGTGNPVTHSYAASAGYVVSVTVTDANGATNTASRTVTVAGAVADSDGDGINDNVDTQPFNPSNEFSDVPLGGTTTGTITDRGDQALTVIDAPGPMDGVQISAAASGGLGPATVSLCSGAGMATLTPGDSIIGTCSSVTITVVSGTVDVTFTDSSGTTATATLSTGGSLTFDPVTFTLTNSGTTPVTVTINGDTLILSPGATESPPFAIFTTAPVKPGQVLTVSSPIKFDATGSFSINSPITFYLWSFGDGSTISGVDGVTIVTHTYTAAGTYTVSLTVNDRFGGTDTATTTLVVNAAPILDSIGFKRNLSASRPGGLTQTFRATVTNPNSYAIYVNVEISGIGDTVGFFTVSSGPVLVMAGETKDITLTKTFSSLDVNTTWISQVVLTYTSDTSMFPTDTSTFELAATRAFSFQIKP